MGYSYEMFDDLSLLSLPKGGRVLDLGSQDLCIMDTDQLGVVNRFIGAYQGEPLSRDLVGKTVPVEGVWQRAGFEYACVDVDERPGTVRVDLQGFFFPAEVRARFDLVTNMGTTEHLAAPAIGLAFMHYACMPGGIIFNDVPIFGWGNHGLANLTPKFWWLLEFLNGYKRVICRVRKCDESHVDAANFRTDDLLGIEGLADACDISWMIRYVATKSKDRAFITPFDAVLPLSNGFKEASIMAESLSSYIGSQTWTETDAISAINYVVAHFGKPYRLGEWPSRLAGYGSSFARRGIYKLKRLTS